MSYAVRSLSAALLATIFMGCAAPTGSGSDDGAVTTSESALDEAGTITFGADFKVQTIGILQRTKKVRIAYDASRLPTCRGDFMGNPGWSVGGFWRMGDAGEVHAFEVAGFSPTGGHGDGPVLTLAQAGELQVWFQNTSRWGCSAFDSDFGKNYRFAVKPAAADPGWMGNVSSVTSRATCDGKACDADVRPITGDVLYDTYTRQRTAIREVLFEVWKEGVTDFDNAELWKQLDVQVHSRLGGAGPFATTAYVPFDRRQGNNARYGVDLRGLDPILGLGTVTKKSDCPAVTLTVDPTGTYVEAVVELYFTVNGAELRPSSGGGYRVRYQNYKQPYAICL